MGEATLCTTTPSLFLGGRREAYNRLELAVQMARYGTDCYAYAMVAAGYVDLVVEVGLQSYDIVALIPIIEKAGGKVTNWDGGPAEKRRRDRGWRIAVLHEAALGLLHGGCLDALFSPGAVTAL